MGSGEGDTFLCRVACWGPRLGCSVGRRVLWSELVVGVDERFGSLDSAVRRTRLRFRCAPGENPAPASAVAGDGGALGRRSPRWRHHCGGPHCKFVVRVVCPVGFVLGLSSARWCAAPGVGVVVGAAAPCFASALSRFEVFLGCRPWPLGWLGRRLVWYAAPGPACCVVLYRFSASFPNKLAILLSYINEWQVSCLVSKKKKKILQQPVSSAETNRFPRICDIQL
jgi:hypothetical protein